MSSKRERGSSQSATKIPIFGSLPGRSGVRSFSPARPFASGVNLCSASPSFGAHLSNYRLQRRAQPWPVEGQRGRGEEERGRVSIKHTELTLVDCFKSENESL